MLMLRRGMPVAWEQVLRPRMTKLASATRRAARAAGPQKRSCSGESLRSAGIPSLGWLGARVGPWSRHLPRCP
jgi:hypothetical protein